MSDESLRLRLPSLAEGQRQKHVTLNEALESLDALVQLSVKDRDLGEPPAGLDGDRYIVAAGATGAWSDHANRIAVRRDGAWLFYPPNEGWVAWVEDENLLVAWNGSNWSPLGGGSPSELQGIGRSIPSRRS